MGSLHPKPTMWNCDAGTVAYNCARMGLSSPEILLPLWEKTGVIAHDYSGNNHHFSLGSNMGWEPTGLVGGNDTLATNQAHLLNYYLSGPFTMVIRAYTREAADYVATFAGGRGAGAGGCDFKFSPVTSKIHGDVGGDVIWYDTTADMSLSGSINVFYTVAYVCNLDGWKGYINGQYIHGEASYLGTPELTKSGTFCVGHSAAGSEVLNGGVEYFYLFRGEVNPTQIKELYNNPYGMFEPIRRVSWKVPAAGGLSIPVAMHHYRQQRIS